MPRVKVGRRFTAVLAADWRGVLDCKWNSKQTLIFSHVVLPMTLSSHKVREIRARIDRQLDLWERGMHAGLVRDALGKGRYRVVHVARSNEEEKVCLARRFHIKLLSGKLSQVVCRDINCLEGGGVFSQGKSAQIPGNLLLLIAPRDLDYP